ncbi:MAG TPA: response regulator transcription factor [Flavitalea sp.]|nr:response regulator transcription factor [Flavitalea sp.]
MDEIQILIVEDEPVIAENIAHYLNNHDFKVCGIAYDADEAKMFLENGSPDAIVLDINLESEMDGLDIAAYVNSHYRIPFILLTSYADRETIEKAKKVKPWGYIVKPFNEDTLLASLEMAISNFAQTQNRDQPEPRFDKINKHLISQVSEREFEVLKLIYAGKTNQQIAEALFVSVNTVKKHINSAYLKLDVLTRTTAIARIRELMIK